MTLRLPLCSLALLLAVAPALGQDPASSADRPPGNVNELTVAGIQPGRTTLAAAERKLGPGWRHPAPGETNVYMWCDAATRLAITLDMGATAGNAVQAITVERPRVLPPGCAAHLDAGLGRTGRGVALGESETRLRGVYGTPFFHGPAEWNGADVDMIVYNFAWAGEAAPQIMESSFDRQGKLVKITLSAQYY